MESYSRRAYSRGGAYLKIVFCIGGLFGTIYCYICYAFDISYFQYLRFFNSESTSTVAPGLLFSLLSFRVGAYSTVPKKQGGPTQIFILTENCLKFNKSGKIR